MPESEVEVVFGFWAIVLVLAIADICFSSIDEALAYAESGNNTEPLVGFVVKGVAASRPVLSTITPVQHRDRKPGR